MPKDRDKETFDDLFEPFELDEYAQDDEPQTGSRPVPAVQEPDAPATVSCPSCGAANPEHNRHCEQCGARVSKGPLPVAPPPMMRSTPGARALTVLAGVVIVVVVVAVILNVLGGGNGDDVTALPEDEITTTTQGTDVTTAPATQTALVPVTAEASSSHPGLDPEFLIDGDPATYWNDNSQRGQNAVLTFTFAQPVAISEMELINIADDIAFKRNYRIKDAQVTVDDLSIEVPFLMPDNNAPHRVPLNTLETRRVTISVLSTYVGEPVGDSPSFSELALAEVRFFGTVNE